MTEPETNYKTEFNGTNFVGFMKKLNPKLRKYRPEGVWVESKAEQLAAFDIIMNNISCKIAETVPTKGEDPAALLKNEVGTALKTSKVIKKPFEERFCGYCKENGHPKIFKTHNETDCKAKGWDRERAEKEKSGQGNKTDQAYYDTGASNHMSPIIPETLDKTTQGSIETATGSKTPIEGKSKFKLGEIVVENVLCAPGLDFNLVSGSQLAKDGYVAVIDRNSDHDLVISKNGEIMATGNFNDQDLLVVCFYSS